MKSVMLGAIALFVVSFVGNPAFCAIPAATVFPPVTLENTECGSDQLRVLSWAKGVPSTVCLTGQQVLSLAIPDCSPRQHVVYDGNKFICESAAAIPTCGPKQSLSFDGANYICTSSEQPPVCAADEVLSYNGASFVCVSKAGAVPTCLANQRLTYNGSIYQCATNTQLELPTCTASQVLTSDGERLLCVEVPGQFGGAYELQPDRGCRRANPATNACTCPPLFSASPYNEFAQTSGWNYTSASNWGIGAPDRPLGYICHR